MTQNFNYNGFEIESRLRTARLDQQVTLRAMLGEPEKAPKVRRFQRRVTGLRGPVEIQSMVNARWAEYPPAI